MPVNRKIESYLWIVLALASPVAPLILYFSGNWYSFFHSFSFGMVLGIFAYGYFLNTLILSSRIRHFDRLAGHDRILVFHRYLATTAFIFALGHLLFKIVYSFDLSTQMVLGICGLTLFASVMSITSVAMIKGMLYRIQVIRNIRSWILTTLHFDYSGLKLFHNLTTAASLCVAVHVFLASSTQETSARSLLMASWAAIALALYLWHKGIRPLRNLRAAFTVDSVTPLAPGIVELSLNPGQRPLINHKAGQFGYFRILDKACGIAEHPFTISSPPNAGHTTITVKNSGDYTARLPNVLKGSKVLIDGPYGIFTPQQNGRPKLFIAGGIGITPFLSIINEWDRAKFRQPVTLIWSCRDLSTMIHRDALEESATRHKNFTFIPVISGDAQRTAYARRIDRQLLEKQVLLLERNRLEAYVCGPESLRRSVTAHLRSIGIMAGNVHFENFSS